EKERGKTFYEAETRLNGRGRDLRIDPAGHVVEIEEEVDMTRVPDAVRTAIKKRTAGGTVTKIESLARRDQRIYAYEVEAKMGGKRRSFKISPRGRLLANR